MSFSDDDPTTARRRAALRLFLPIVIGACLAAQPVRAQLNVEAVATTVDEPGAHGLLNSLVSLEAGNVELLTLDASAAFVFTNAHPQAPAGENPGGFWFRDRFLTNGGATFKRTPEGRLANGGFIHLRYTRMQWLRVGFEVFTQLQNDEFRLLSRRVVGGGGGRFVLAHFDDFSIWYGTGYLVESEKRNIPPEDRPPSGPDPLRMVNHRWNNYLTWLALEEWERLSLANTLYVQPRFDDPADVQVLDELSLSASLTEVFSLTLGFSFRYDSRAPRSVERYDVQLSQGLTAKL